jgi:hypothetical protein
MKTIADKIKVGYRMDIASAVLMAVPPMKVPLQQKK